MPVDFMVRFVGHIVESKRPLNFPKEVYSDMLCRVDDDQGLKKAINDMCLVFLTQQCMIVPKTPGAMEDLKKVKHDSRMVIPLHMVTHIDTITTRLSNLTPMLAENGQPELEDGTKVIIQ